eukprot:CAMPEP_0184678470 /NCGR_PEP_ID=MMETSP0312-20130426/1208_1 /TAXON_ID=31354 /ORGANISM="Compsopogon coeruleus, Strain SAG 36.94" /LENGTH=318 /DNA_ID=CAMNT_0027127227 /DNA_START=168 /DNA_END=1124 /DNA_ORIENTATION=-
MDEFFEQVAGSTRTVYQEGKESLKESSSESMLTSGPSSFMGSDLGDDFVVECRRKTGTCARQRPFRCGFLGCPAGFAKKYNLRVHERIHSGEKPFRCRMKGCSERFRWKSGLKSHLRKAHNLTQLEAETLERQFSVHEPAVQESQSTGGAMDVSCMSSELPWSKIHCSCCVHAANPEDTQKIAQSTKDTNVDDLAWLMTSEESLMKVAEESEPFQGTISWLNLMDSLLNQEKEHTSRVQLKDLDLFSTRNNNPTPKGGVEESGTSGASFLNVDQGFNDDGLSLSSLFQTETSRSTLLSSLRSTTFRQILLMNLLLSES